MLMTIVCYCIVKRCVASTNTKVMHQFSTPHHNSTSLLMRYINECFFNLFITRPQTDRFFIINKQRKKASPYRNEIRRNPRDNCENNLPLTRQRVENERDFGSV